MPAATPPLATISRISAGVLMLAVTQPFRTRPFGGIWNPDLRT
jgi:hypothetical protein